EGGEGNSRIGLVMRALLGENMNMGNLAKIEINQFARADLVHKLLLVDDDLPLEALPSTNYIKSIISAEGKMDVEQKGKQSVQAVMYCRFLGFGNGAISAMHDRSRGFFRRQIILRTKARPAGRKDQPFLIDYLLEEKEGIFLWCLSGLRRLRKNNYSFTLSETAKKNLADAAKDSNNILEFMRSEGYIEKNPEWYTTSKQLCRAYAKWCDDNACHAFADRTLIAYLREHQERYGIVYTNKIPNGETFVRGFAGMRVRV
ncbi:MAG: DNA primase, partial [Clostridia bacterium]|nr:DNA primase [Clostridia bacterium]